MEETNAVSQSPEEKIRNLQDENIRLQQLLKTRVIPQQENAWNILSEGLTNCKSVFERKVLEYNQAMVEAQKRFLDLETNFRKEMDEMILLQSNLYAEHSRMIASLPDDARPTPGRPRVLSMSATPKRNILSNSPARRTPNMTPKMPNDEKRKIQSFRKTLSPSITAMIHACGTPKSDEEPSPLTVRQVKPSIPLISRQVTVTPKMIEQSIVQQAPLDDDEFKNGIQVFEERMQCVTKIFDKPSKSPALSLIAEESTRTIPTATPTIRKRRIPVSQVSTPSTRTSHCSTPGDADLCCEETSKRAKRAAAPAGSLKEPSAKTKMRQPRTKKTK